MHFIKNKGYDKIQLLVLAATSSYINTWVGSIGTSGCFKGCHLYSYFVMRHPYICYTIVMSSVFVLRCNDIRSFVASCDL